MLSRSQEKLLRKLRSRKYRWEYRLFVAEGRKVVTELLQELEPRFLITDSKTGWKEYSALQVGSDVLKAHSSLDTPDEVLGVFPFPEASPMNSHTVLILDGLRDPGNLGTIMRTCEWFGLQTIYCTPGTVDVFNAKTVQSTMGSIARVGVEYLPEQEILDTLKAGGYDLLCADMVGADIAEVAIPSRTALIMGSESHGPSDFWKQNAQLVTIPRKGNSKAESLNVAIATAILLSAIAG